jgi:mannitol-1-/sugar-/sorbitol-6-phosphatase
MPYDSPDERCVVNQFECAAILFDLDGVLVDSTPSVDKAWKLWAARRGFDAERVIAGAHGRRTEETIKEIASHLDPEAEAADLERIEVEDAENVLKVNGANDLIASLPPESWAVVTSGTRMLATARMRHTDLPIPRVLVGAEDVQNGKPDPECYLKAAEMLGVAASECVVVEDAPAGVRAGRDAGMSVVAVAATHTPADLVEADAMVQALSCIHCRTVEQTGSKKLLVEFTARD